MAKAERAKWDDEWIQAFAGSWKRVYRSSFPELYSKYLTDLEPGKATKRGQAIYRLSQLYDVNRQAITSRAPEDWQKMIEGIEAGGILLELMEVDDKYYQAISQIGSYSDLWERHLAPVGLKLEGSFNDLWTNGGLMYPPPAR